MTAPPHLRAAEPSSRGAVSGGTFAPITERALSETGTMPETARGRSPRPFPATTGLVRWILVVGPGEFVAFAFPAAAGVLVSSSGTGNAVIITAGFFEGVILGAAQYFAMRRRLPGLRPRAWVLLTGAGAVVAYLCGLLPSSWSGWMTWPAPLQFAGLAILAAFLLVSIGVAQWVELRRLLRGAGWWVLGTSVAWLIGLAFFFVIAPPLWHEGQPVGTAIAIGLIAGAAMAVAMAVVTGLTFGWLLTHDRAMSAVRQPAPVTSGSSSPDGWPSQHEGRASAGDDSSEYGCKREELP